MITALRTFSAWTLRTKFVVLFLLLILIPLGFQSAITFRNFSGALDRQAIGYTEQIIKQMNTDLERTLRDDMQKFSLMVLYNQELLGILEKYSLDSVDKAPDVNERTRIFQYIAGYDFSRSYIKGVQIITNNGYIFSNVAPDNIRPALPPGRKEWIERIKLAEGRWVILPRQRSDYLLQQPQDGSVSMASLILEPSSAQVIGMIKVDFTDELFTRLSANYQNKQIGNLFVVNDRNELFYRQSGLEASSDEDFLNASIPKENEATKLRIGGLDYLTTAGHSSFSGLRIVSFNPVDSLLEETKPLLRSTILFGLLCLGFAGLLAVFTSYKLTRPLMQLRRKMLLVRQGKLRQTVEIDSRDELGHLSREFNLMTEEIDRLVNEVYLISLKEKEAQLSALQSQINPHFIYNTLESINMMAIQSSDYRVSDTVHALGQFLRYTVDKYDRLVELREELESVLAYMMIQNNRFGNRLKLIVDADEAYERIRVPKLLLQPLVENAIIHGFDDMKREGTIWVSAVRLEEVLLLTVKDDGKGMNEEEMLQLRQSLRTDQPLEASGQRQGLALRNIHQRLVLIYGPEYGLDIDGTPGRGASFTITVPIRKEETL
ncbi:sensor histidine kinase [Cohnella sp. LGH]|uniref:sensor histidine kinase n=1 Tax=Cohnella sp. LGH TaxID=1619153 RepID=UPI001AD9DF65|nr:sensor histidine kinase [Cohnella sp. LGH]QTH44250.1 sensor histidine kinase [Cohnella sp. LGH]